MREKLMLIDGHSMLNRAYFGLPDMTNAEGLHTNAVYGFLKILFKVLEEERPQYLTVAFDVHAPTFRHRMYSEYKGTRRPMQQELREQVPVMKELLRAMGICVVELAGYEADDLIGTLSVRAEKAGKDVCIVSGDRDLLQLATDHVRILIPKTKKTGTEIEEYDAAAVQERYLVSPKAFVDMKALMGDASDNIPGVAGIGEKGAAKLIAQYGSLEEVFSHLDEVKPKRTQSALAGSEEIAYLSRDLARICTDAPVDWETERSRLGSFDTPEAYEIMRRLEFRQFLDLFSADSKQDLLTERVRQVGFSEACQMLQADDAPAPAVISVCYDVPLDSETGQIAWYEGGDDIYYVNLNTARAESREDRMRYLSARDVPTDISEAGCLLYLLLERADTLICPDGKTLVHQLGIEETISRAQQEKIEDITIKAYLLNPLKGSYPYDALSSEYAGIMLPAREDLVPKKRPKEMDDETYDACCGRAACAGAYAYYYANAPMDERIAQMGMEHLYRQIEKPLIFVLAAMEARGIRANREALQEYGAALGEQIRVTEQEIYEMAGEEFNILSPKQLGVILFEKLGLPNGKRTKTGYSTAADVLEKLAPDYPIVSKILFYRALTKLKSTYADALADQIGSDGRIHTTFHQTITATGRLSSSDPNLQNIPVRMEMGRQIRKVFVPADGCVFVDADYSQIELRVLAHLSGDENLIAAYNQAQDIHRLTASQVFHVPFDEVTDLQRRNAKAVNFGIIYGMSAYGLSQDLSISRKEAGEYIDQYFAAYPKIKAYLDGLVTSAKETGYAVTLFGRIRPMPELTSSNFTQRSFGERAAMNAPIQGTAADIMKIAMLRVDARLKEEGLRSRILLQVHDELIIEAPREEAQAVTELLRTQMEQAADLKVKLEADVHQGNSWYEAK